MYFSCPIFFWTVFEYQAIANALYGLRGFTLKNDESSAVTHSSIDPSLYDTGDKHDHGGNDSNSYDNDDEEYMEDNKYHKVDTSEVIIEVYKMSNIIIIIIIII